MATEMPPSVELRVDGDGPSALRELETWLSQPPQLRGRVRPSVAAPEPGEMGAVPEVLVVALGQGGAATALASVLISWIRRQTSRVSLQVKSPSGREFTVEADAVRGLTAEALKTQVAALEAELNRDRPTD